MHGFTVGTGAPRSGIALWTDDIDAAYAQLLANGATPLSPPHEFLGRLRAAWVAAPEGNHVQMVMDQPKATG
jgi:predicted enzyme related to lactoylglutathione lyase